MNESDDYIKSEVEKSIHLYCISDSLEVRDSTYQYKSERALLASILFRAYADLSTTIAYNDRASAIKWFRRQEALSPEFTSFQNIVSVLELTTTQVKTILVKVKAAEHYQDLINDKFKTKGEKSRTHHMPVAERPWDSLCEEIGTVSRRPRLG